MIKATVRIQSLARGYRARKELQEQEAAASRVQASFRGHHARHLLFPSLADSSGQQPEGTRARQDSDYSGGAEAHVWGSGGGLSPPDFVQSEMEHQAHVRELNARITQLEAERDAAVREAAGLRAQLEASSAAAQQGPGTEDRSATHTEGKQRRCSRADSRRRIRSVTDLRAPYSEHSHIPQARRVLGYGVIRPELLAAGFARDDADAATLMLLAWSPPRLARALAAPWRLQEAASALLKEVPPDEWPRRNDHARRSDEGIAATQGTFLPLTPSPSRRVRRCHGPALDPAPSPVPGLEGEGEGEGAEPEVTSGATVERREDAATRMQAAYRGYRVRSRPSRRPHEAAAAARRARLVVTDSGNIRVVTADETTGTGGARAEGGAPPEKQGKGEAKAETGETGESTTGVGDEKEEAVVAEPGTAPLPPLVPPAEMEDGTNVVTWAEWAPVADDGAGGSLVQTAAVTDPSRLVVGNRVPPSPRAACAYCRHGAYLFVHGGAGEDPCLHALHIPSLVWSAVAVHLSDGGNAAGSSVLPPLTGHAMCALSGGKLLLAGSEAGGDALRAWVIEVEAGLEGEWRPLEDNSACTAARLPPGALTPAAARPRGARGRGHPAARQRPRGVHGGSERRRWREGDPGAHDASFIDRMPRPRLPPRLPRRRGRGRGRPYPGARRRPPLRRSRGEWGSTHLRHTARIRTGSRGVARCTHTRCGALCGFPHCRPPLEPQVRAPPRGVRGRDAHGAGWMHCHWQRPCAEPGVVDVGAASGSWLGELPAKKNAPDARCCCHRSRAPPHWAARGTSALLRGIAWWCTVAGSRAQMGPHPGCPSSIWKSCGCSPYRSPTLRQTHRWRRQPAAGPPAALSCSLAASGSRKSRPTHCTYWNWGSRWSRRVHCPQWLLPSVVPALCRASPAPTSPSL